MSIQPTNVARDGVPFIPSAVPSARRTREFVEFAELMYVCPIDLSVRPCAARTQGIVARERIRLAQALHHEQADAHPR